jgi:alkyl sulfatase BDS1-like metallo-beta-lactamase superfamily hydrolase
MTATAARAPISPDVVRGMSLDLFFDYLAVRLDGERAEGRRMVIDWVFPDAGQRYALTLDHSALTYLAERTSERPDAVVTLDRTVLDRLVLREMPLARAVDQGLVRITGDATRVAELFGLLDDFRLMFEVVEPRRDGAAADGKGGPGHAGA